MTRKTKKRDVVAPQGVSRVAKTKPATILFGGKCDRTLVWSSTHLIFHFHFFPALILEFLKNPARTTNN
jgi:hypothetical protein